MFSRSHLPSSSTRPLSMTSVPTAARARAMPRPIPLVDPIIIADLSARLWLRAGLLSAIVKLCMEKNKNLRCLAS